MQISKHINFVDVYISNITISKLYILTGDIV